GASFPPEPLARTCIRDHTLANHLDRDRTGETVVNRLVDNAHSALAELSSDVVPADLRRHHGFARSAKLPRDRGNGGLVEERLRRDCPLEKRLYLEPQCRIVATVC